MPLLHGKNGFAEVSKNLGTDPKIILLEHENNSVERFNVGDNAVKSFNILAASLDIHSKKYFLYLYICI